MGLFSKNKTEGGALDVIRCDQPSDYLIWKWSPNGVPSRRENAIRWGSTMRVKEGEVAVFVYHQNEGKEMDFFEGPIDTTLKTANFPVLSNLLGKVFGGDTPFQAEIYFINLAGNVKMPFYIPPFDVADPRFPDFAVPVTVQGQILMNITDYKSFIKLHRMVQFDMDDFIAESRASIVQSIRTVVTNTLMNSQIPLLQIGRFISNISTIVQDHMKIQLAEHFGVNLKRMDLTGIELDKESEGYIELHDVTTAQSAIKTKARTADEVERLSMAREIDLKRQRLSAETDHLATHRLNLQADVSKTAAESLGELGGSGMGGSGDGINPAGMMAGMMLGGAVGGNMANMMNGMMGGMQGGMQDNTQQTMMGTMQPGMPGQMPGQPAGTPPPKPGPPPLTVVQYFVAVEGQQTGPFAQSIIQQMILDARIARDTLVWKQGMPAWEAAGNVADLSSIFNSVPPKL